MGAAGLTLDGLREVETGLSTPKPALALSRWVARAVQLAAAGGVLAAALAIPHLLSAYGVHVAIVALYYAALGVSWNLIAGYTGQFSLAHHAFAALGAYASAGAVLVLGFPIWLGILTGTLTAAASGYILGSLTLRMRGIYLAITTWAFAESFRILLSVNYQVTRGDMGLIVPLLLGTLDPVPNYYVFLGLTVGLIGLTAVILRSKVGLRIRAIRDDEEAAAVRGIDVVRWKKFIFTLTAATAGLAGAVYGHYVGLLAPSQVRFTEMAFIIIAVVLGGFRSFWGPVVGAVAAEGLAEALRLSGEARMVIFALVVILLMRVYPAGLVGLAAALARRLRPRP